MKEAIKMSRKQKFYICRICGNLVGMSHDSEVEIICCGQPMEELVPNTVDAANEKHLPVVSVAGDKVTVKVGSVEHPMIDAHYLPWIYLETKKGGQRKNLVPGDKPQAVFSVLDDEAVAVFSYCNLHGLWETQL
jgi:superoxide reductase